MAMAPSRMCCRTATPHKFTSTTHSNKRFAAGCMSTSPRTLTTQNKEILMRIQDKLKQLKSKRGFTLVELMIVVAIIGVLAALAIYGVRKYLTNAKSAEARSA